MSELRANAPKQIGAYKVEKLRDYQNDTITEMESGKVEPTGLPKSNVLYYELSDNAWLCVRPSGTEPKIKFYFGVCGSSLEDADQKAEEMKKALDTLVKPLM